MPLSTTDQKALLAFLDRRHPEYFEELPHWEFLEDTYEGGREWFEEHIFRYIKEGDTEYKSRCQRAYRFNHTREIVDLLQKYIFKSPVSRNTDDAPQQVMDFWDNATLSGLDINQFMRLVSTQSSIFGRVWVFTDTNKTSNILTKQDEKTAGARVYAYIVTPQDVLDIGFNEQGGVNWILVRETWRDDLDPILSTGAEEERFRLWMADEWYLFRIVLKKNSTDRVVEIVDQGVNALGRVPCFPVDHVIGENRYCAPALIDDIAYLDRATANYLSNLDAIIQDQTFSQLVMPAQSTMPGEDKYNKLLEMGTKRIFLYDGEGGAEPKYISPDPKQAQIIITVINKIINEIYHSVGMAGERTKQDNAVGIDNSSGVAKAYDFERLNSLLTTKSASLENAENKLVELVCAWQRVTPPAEELVRYADTFDVRSLFDEFTVAERLALIDAPDELRREQMKQVIDKLFPTLGADIKDAMLKNLKQWPPDVSGLSVTGTVTGSPPKSFPAKGVKAPPKNAATSNRQGQVTSTTG